MRYAIVLLGTLALVACQKDTSRFAAPAGIKARAQRTINIATKSFPARIEMREITPARIPDINSSMSPAAAFTQMPTSPPTAQAMMPNS